MTPMNEDTKRRVRELVREKIRLEDLLQFETSDKRRKSLEDELYETLDSIDKLTNGVWFYDEDNHKLMKERQGVH